MNERGFTHLVVGPDYAAFPVWDRSPRHVQGTVRAEYLGISDALAQSLEQWCEEWEDDTNPIDVTSWEARGRELTAELQSELGAAVTVAFYTDGIDAPRFDVTGFAEDHRGEPGTRDSPSGFSRR